MEECGDEIAAIMLEPIACNMGMVKPLPGFLEAFVSSATSMARFFSSTKSLLDLESV